MSALAKPDPYDPAFDRAAQRTETALADLMEVRGVERVELVVTESDGRFWRIVWSDQGRVGAP